MVAHPVSAAIITAAVPAVYVGRSTARVLRKKWIEWLADKLGTDLPEDLKL